MSLPNDTALSLRARIDEVFGWTLKGKHVASLFDAVTNAEELETFAGRRERQTLGYLTPEYDADCWEIDKTWTAEIVAEIRALTFAATPEPVVNVTWDPPFPGTDLGEWYATYPYRSVVTASDGTTRAYAYVDDTDGADCLGCWHFDSECNRVHLFADDLDADEEEATDLETRFAAAWDYVTIDGETCLPPHRYCDTCGRITTLSGYCTLCDHWTPADYVPTWRREEDIIDGGLFLGRVVYTDYAKHWGYQLAGEITWNTVFTSRDDAIDALKHRADMIAETPTTASYVSGTWG